MFFFFFFALLFFAFRVSCTWRRDETYYLYVREQHVRAYEGRNWILFFFFLLRTRGIVEAEGRVLTHEKMTRCVLALVCLRSYKNWITFSRFSFFFFLSFYSHSIANDDQFVKLVTSWDSYDLYGRYHLCVLRDIAYGILKREIEWEIANGIFAIFSSHESL